MTITNYTNEDKKQIDDAVRCLRDTEQQCVNHAVRLRDAENTDLIRVLRQDMRDIIDIMKQEVRRVDHEEASEILWEHYVEPAIIMAGNAHAFEKIS